MASFQHKNLVEQIAVLDSPPSDKDEFAEWVQAGAHLDFLEANARSVTTNRICLVKAPDLYRFYFSFSNPMK